MKSIFFVFTLFVFCSCKSKTDKKSLYPTIDYLLVKRKLDTLNAEIKLTGYKPTFTTLTKGNKTIVFFGASHVQDSLHPQFEALRRVFIDLKPEVAFNEGGQLPDSLHFRSLGKAIEADGETGLAKYLCDNNGTKLFNGDMDTSEEFKILLKHFPKEQVFLYLAIERFLHPYKNGYLANLPIEQAYQKGFIAYLRKHNFPVDSESLDYIKTLYMKYFKTPLTMGTLIEVHDYYLMNTGIFGKIGRKSKDIRDQVLLQKIDDSLDTFDRVFVVFGASHWVAVQPALNYIISKK
ncbi:MAG: hypothetical protein ACRCVT_05820 [Leadbetterella sp.]